MVYESDFYTSRRPYSRPTVTSYSVTTPRHYVVVDTPERPRRAEEQYSYSYSSDVESRRDTSNPYSAPSRSYSSSSERVSRSTSGGPGGSSYSTERSSRTSDAGGPGGYHASYSSSTSGRLPHGTTYRHYSYRDGLRLPGVGKGQTFHRNIPAIAHKRLVIFSPSAYTHTHTRPSVIIGEMDRIYHKVRPSLAYQPTEDYLNSDSMVTFNDETRSIRAQTADLLKRIHTPVPRAQRPLPLPGDVLELTEQPTDWYDWYDWYPEELGQTRLRLKLLSLKRDLSDLETGSYYSHSELPITDRITSDAYIDRLLTGQRNVARDINIMSHYEEPARRCNNIGQGHLACMSFAGGRPIAKRHNLARDNVKNDVNVLSRYGRLRAAAAAAATPPTEPAYEPSLHRPPTKSAVTGSWKSNAPRNKEHSSATLTAGDEFDAAQERKQRRRDALEAAAQREVTEDRRRKNENSRQDELAQQAILEREQELQRKAEEEEQRKAEEQENAAKQEEERLAREEEERLIAEEQRLIEEEEALLRQQEEDKKAKKAKKEAEKKAKEEAERAKAEAERQAREEEERKVKEEAEKREKEEEEKRIRDEEERLAREEQERIAKEEAEKKIKEEEERLAREEAERIAKEEAERIAKEEAERKAAEEEELAKQEAERIAQEQATEATETPVEEVPAPAEEPSEEPIEQVQVSEEAPTEIAVQEEPIVEEPTSPVEETPQVAEDAVEEEEDEAEEE